MLFKQAQYFLLLAPFVLGPLILISSCAKDRHSVASNQSGNKAQMKDSVPEYLLEKPTLYVRNKKGEPIEAPKQDQDVAASYRFSKLRSDTSTGVSLTILSRKTVYAIHEPVRIIHVLEIRDTGWDLHVMGPKEIQGEYINDSLVSRPPRENSKDPWVPGIYDGVVLSSPGVDFNFEITEYVFDKPGTYRVQWRLGKYNSNILVIVVE
jgi:hypothetical protein